MGSKFNVTEYVGLPIDSSPFRSMSISPAIPWIDSLNPAFSQYDHENSRSMSSLSHISRPTLHRLILLLLHVNRPSHSWNTKFSIIKLENWRLRWWERSKFKTTKRVPLPVDSRPFRSMSMSPPIPVESFIVYVKGECQSTMLQIKHYFSHVIRCFLNLALKIQVQGHKPVILPNYGF